MELTAKSLPEAIKALFELNNYQVSGPLQVHGAEIDLVAHPLSDPFSTPVYIEATVEYVDNDKYGKDVGKLALIAVKEPEAHRLIVSSKGFSLPVRERAAESRIRTLTYDELFRRFEKFDPYIEHFTGVSQAAQELETLSKVYEEPLFEDAVGKDPAIAYLDRWRESSAKDQRWLVITGEYGTGKTALTKVIQRRWLISYKNRVRLHCIDARWRSADTPKGASSRSFHHPQPMTVRVAS